MLLPYIVTEWLSLKKSSKITESKRAPRSQSPTKSFRLCLTPSLLKIQLNTIVCFSVSVWFRHLIQLLYVPFPFSLLSFIIWAANACSTPFCSSCKASLLLLREIKKLYIVQAERAMCGVRVSFICLEERKGKAKEPNATKKTEIGK